jgi:hypothetical protein
MTLREWWCLTMPWHRTKVIDRYAITLRTKCMRCGCEWGIHPGEGIALPWRLIADEHAELQKAIEDYKP